MAKRQKIYNFDDVEEVYMDPPFSEEWGELDILTKDNENKRVWWTAPVGTVGTVLFSFDGKRLYNLWRDYPFNLSEEEQEIFREDEPFWYKKLGHRKRQAETDDE